MSNYYTPLLVGTIDNQSDWDTDNIRALLDLSSSSLADYDRKLASKRSTSSKARGPKNGTIKVDRLRGVFITQHDQTIEERHDPISVGLQNRSSGARYTEWTHIEVPSPAAAGLSPMVLVAGRGRMPHSLVRAVALGFLGMLRKGDAYRVLPKQLPPVATASDPAALAARRAVRVNDAVEAQVENLTRRASQNRSRDDMGYVFKSAGLVCAASGQASPSQVARIRNALADVVLSSEQRHKALVDGINAYLATLGTDG